MKITFTFDKGNWQIGFIYRIKPRRFWVQLPTCGWFIELGKICSSCEGCGTIVTIAGDGEWADNCETCEGTGRIK